MPTNDLPQVCLNILIEAPVEERARLADIVKQMLHASADSGILTED